MTARLGSSGIEHHSTSCCQSALQLIKTTTLFSSCPNSGKATCCLHETS
ncbi:hypothetical protein GQ600_500 [Phytophthora cactorum]|nr:hypothetical protein GQ600_500 [Phytophthora cactorum]